MKRTLIVSLMFVFTAFSLAPRVFPETHLAPNQHTRLQSRFVAPDQRMPLGEHLVYDIFWFGFRVGIGEFWVKEKTMLNGREAFHVVGTARTNSFLSTIYPVQNEAQSWIDARTFESLRFDKIVNERSTSTDEENVFDAASRTGHTVFHKTGQTKDFSVTLPVHDVLSTFYWVRRQELVPGRSLTTILSCDQKDWIVEIDVLRREVKRLRGHGIVDAILIEPKAEISGVTEHQEKLWVYLKNDARRTPLYIRLKTRFGPVVGVLRRPPSPHAR